MLEGFERGPPASLSAFHKADKGVVVTFIVAPKLLGQSYILLTDKSDAHSYVTQENPKKGVVI